jgi:serine/threonine-protein kinase
MVTRATDGDEDRAVIALGLSSSFDSNEATMRLAAMTASKEEVEELSKTLRTERPSMAEINRAAPRTGTPRPVRNRADPPSKGGGYMLLVIVVLIVLGLFFALIF